MPVALATDATSAIHSLAENRKPVLTKHIPTSYVQDVSLKNGELPDEGFDKLVAATKLEGASGCTGASNLKVHLAAPGRGTGRLEVRRGPLV